ncbi:MAG: helix-turn-helix domain-containing protein [Proteobacteria bacterium]|nr:helix-turn-helix domain-containing protein [Pseudomonadota bacterium]
MTERTPTGAAALVEVVATNVRALRGQIGMSLSELAHTAGIGKSTLSMLESGNANPSIETLWAIAAALGVPLGQLIEPRAPDVRVVRAGEGIRIDSEDVISLHSELLISSNRRVTFEFYSMELEPGEVREAAPHNRGVVEYVFVTAGRLRVGPEASPVVLNTGDLASFAADTRHVYESLEPGTRAILLMEYQ